MTDKAISPILARLADIIADLNQTLTVAREQGVPHQVSVMKMLGDPPTYSVQLIVPPPPPEAPPADPAVTAGDPAVTEGRIP